MTIACIDCGSLEELSTLAPGSTAMCPVCERSFERSRGRSITAALACSMGTFLLLFPANLIPLMSVDMLRMHRSARLGAGVIQIWNDGWIILAPLIGAFAVILPFVRFGLLSLVLGEVRLGRRPRWLGPAFRWAVWLDVWAMPDVFLVGCFVGYSRVAASLNVKIEAGGYCFIAAALLSMLSRASIDLRSVWRAISEDRPITGLEPVLSCTTCDLVMPVTAEGQDCPRCGATLHVRKPYSLSRTLALVSAAFILYWPANLFPMSSTLQMGTIQRHRIVDGISELFAAGFAPLGIIIFCTSIAIPVLKIFGLAWCAASVLLGSRKYLVAKTRVYRAVDEIGRWSNVDPFTIAVFVPLMHFGSMVDTHAELGATAFILVVVLTLLASRSFDPRLMWDVAQTDERQA
ncbi:MAG TPA: paraquat-inducible protein A [Candidatus Binataceae bacterium]|nr:paraquat-inducible protein A [Candidatus Binataceae bacterium]